MYHPTGRVLTVLELIQSRPGTTGPEIADRLEVDVRTVRRYVQKLQDVGIPVEASAGRYGGYFLRPGFRLPPLIFTEEEASAVMIGLLGSAHLGLEVSAAAVGSAVSKITRVMPDATRARVAALSDLLFVSDDDDHPRPDWNVIITASQAVHARQTVVMTYCSESGVTTRREVEPYTLVTVRRRWYLIGYCRLRAALRSFRLDRITDLDVTGSSFQRPHDFDGRAYAAEHLQRFSGYLPYAVLFRTEAETLRPRVRGVVARLTQTESGTRMDASTDDFAYEARWLMGIGVPFRVVTPDALRREVVALAGQVLERNGYAACVVDPDVSHRML